jgi:hypothetical protein
LNVITSFNEKHRHKQIEFERKMLRELTFSKIETAAETYFDPFLNFVSGYKAALEEVCVDYAIEAYLLGGSYSRFGYYGEPIDYVRMRSKNAERALINDLYDYWCYWGPADEFVLESVYRASEAYISSWWEQGFYNGEKRYRMRLH